MWVARDKSGILLLFKFFPKRLIDSSNWRRDNSTIVLDSTLFPNIKWEDEPVEVCLCINDEKYHTVKVSTLDRLYNEKKNSLEERINNFNKLPWYK